MPAEQFIFVGFEVTDEMAARFEGCQERDRAFITDPVYLEIAVIDGIKYVGKRIDGGAARDRLEDTARSVVSLLARVCETLSFAPTDARMIATEEQVQPRDSGIIGAAT